MDTATFAKHRPSRLRPNIIRTWSSSRDYRDIVATMDASHIFMVQNVQDFFWRSFAPNGLENLDSKTIQSLVSDIRLPYDECFFEHVFSESWNPFGNTAGKQVPMAIGALFSNVEVDDQPRILLELFASVLDRDDSVIHYMTVYFTPMTGVPVAYHMTEQLRRIMSVRHHPGSMRYHPGAMHYIGMAIVAPTLYALRLLNCKNVRTKEHSPYEHATNKQRKTRAFGANVRYHVLDVPLINRIAEGESGTFTGRKMPLHTVRGHFKTFSHPGAGMFGRGIYGTFWWGNFLAGSKKEGEVHKDYETTH